MAYGSNLRAGQRVMLVVGLAEIQFEVGAVVVLQGPADFEIKDAGRGYLYRGRAVAHVPERARGFVIDSPKGRVVDLGTEFGIAVDQSGETEVHVLEGRVEARLPGQSQPVELRAAEALRVASNNSVTRIAADAAAFVTEMPPRIQEQPKLFFHWSFDEGQGGVARDSGPRVGKTPADLYLTRTASNGRKPAWTDGRFGRGLEFDGEGGFAANGFPGNLTLKPRTVAAWVQVPADFRADKGFAVLGWGNTSPGRRFQLSANPLPEDGELGRLRVDAGAAAVIGTRDLRDGAWHHVAAVMYGDGTSSDADAHVLLYVDGKLEPASRTTVPEATIHPDRAFDGFWFGRNLACFHRKGENLPGGNFFRGAVDEVFIVGAVLSQEQIQRLMLKNEL